MYDFPSNIIGAYIYVEQPEPSKNSPFKLCEERKQLATYIYDEVCAYPDCTTIPVNYEDVERQVCQLDSQNVRLLLTLYQEARENKKAEIEDFIQLSEQNRNQI
ncbi:MAG: hypothetical protein ACFFC7_34985 [Candidatus Hermodarchaeota archaeon]